MGFFTVRRRRCQESCRNLAALRRLLASLYPHWQVIISYVSEGSGGNGERLAFLYDSTRFQPLVLSERTCCPRSGNDLHRQFARTPYTASFARAGVEFTLDSVHILRGKNPAERLPEITAFAQWMHDGAGRPHAR